MSVSGGREAAREPVPRSRANQRPASRSTRTDTLTLASHELEHEHGRAHAHARRPWERRISRQAVITSISPARTTAATGPQSHWSVPPAPGRGPGQMAQFFDDAKTPQTRPERRRDQRCGCTRAGTPPTTAKSPVTRATSTARSRRVRVMRRLFQ